MRGKRTTVAPGIYRDTSGYAVVTKVHGVQKERRYVLDSDLSKLKALRANWIVERKAGTPVAPKHSLAAVIREYLTTLPEQSRRREDAEQLLKPWNDAFKDRLPNSLTPTELRERMAIWQAEGRKPSTLNHRRQELKNLFALLNGKSGANPLRDVPKVGERYDDARGQSPQVVAAILSEMGDSATKIRLRVWWETAIPPADMIRLRRTGFNPRTKTQSVPPRVKGRGVPGQTLELSKAGVAALSAFYEAGLEGQPFSHHSVYKSFKLAVTKAQAKWKGDWPAPANLSPKDLRHSRLTEAYRHSQDLNAVAKLGRHASLSTTQRYVRAAASATARRAVDLMERADGTVPSRKAKTGQKGSKRTTSHKWPHRRKTR